VTTPALPAPVVSIAYHSGYGHTAVLAEAVRAAATEAGATVHLIKVDEITEARSSSARRPTWARPPAPSTPSPRRPPSAGRPAPGRTSSRPASPTPPPRAGTSCTPGWNSSTASENDLNRLGFFMGAAAQSHNDQGAEGVHKADIATAEHLGRRITEQARVFTAGRAALAA
jgi:NAD(P)H dehydrogenase (quinone)